MVSIRGTEKAIFGLTEERGLAFKIIKETGEKTLFKKGYEEDLERVYKFYKGNGVVK